MNRDEILEESLSRLAEEFKTLRWQYPELDVERHREPVLYWPGDPKDDIMICVLMKQDFHEVMHRHDFFFLNYAYRSDYEAEVESRGNIVKIREGECFIGQPFSGYGLRQNLADPAAVIGVLVQKPMFDREFLPIIASDPAIFHFFMKPLEENAYSEDYMHFAFPEGSPVRVLLETMVIEYANRTSDTQAVLRPLVSALLLYIARRFRELHPLSKDATLSERIMRYMSSHTDTVTLEDLSGRFFYHPNYISSLLHRETGRTFSAILTELRMKRAASLLESTKLSTEEIAEMLGYSNSSNFFKTFRSYYGATPREWAAKRPR